MSTAQGGSLACVITTASLGAHAVQLSYTWIRSSTALMACPTLQLKSTAYARQMRLIPLSNAATAQRPQRPLLLLASALAAITKCTSGEPCLLRLLRPPLLSNLRGLFGYSPMLRLHMCWRSVLA